MGWGNSVEGRRGRAHEGYPPPIILYDVGIHLTQVTTISCGQTRSVLAELTIAM